MKGERGCLGIHSEGGMVGAANDKHYVHPLNSLNQTINIIEERNINRITKWEK